MYRTTGESNPHLRRHFLILPLGRAIQAATGLAPEDSLALLCAVSAAAIPTLAYLALRGTFRPVFPSAVAASLLALAPTTVFYGRHVELHAPHGAAAALALVAAMRGGERIGGIGGAALALGSIAALAGTHAGGILQVAFVATLGALRSGGPRRALFLSVAAPSVLACAAAVVWLVAIQAGWVRPPQPDAPFASIAIAFAFPWKFGVRQFLEYARLTILPGAGALLFLGAGGLAFLARRRALEAGLLSLWVLGTLYAYGAWGFTKHGGYLLPTYPALAIGAAELLARLPGRVPARLLAAVAIGLQGFLAARITLADIDEPHPIEWAAGAREGTGNAGVLVTDWLAHRTAAQIHTDLEIVNTGLLAHAPPSERARFASDLADHLVREIEAGKAVHLDAYVTTFRDEWPDLDRLLDLLESRFGFERADRGAFRGWRLRLR
jgi:hypothetical protein